MATKNIGYSYKNLSFKRSTILMNEFIDTIMIIPKDKLVLTSSLC